MVGSLILEDVAKAGGFPAAVIRVGQIAGPAGEKGIGDMDRIDWARCESIAKLVLEVVGVTQKVSPKDISGYFRDTNPSSTTWVELAPAVQSSYGKNRFQKMVSFPEWIAALEKSQATDTQSLDKNPGTRLVDS
ncbi:hypothetical protein F5Y15DRAFT_415137 [Xylariaceae sp. FL0016]|nr:hypothetical protein F5Y15DRAFT_415137 [Xylariaceae sp. FL0016]